MMRVPLSRGSRVGYLYTIRASRHGFDGLWQTEHRLRLMRTRQSQAAATPTHHTPRPGGEFNCPSAHMAAERHARQAAREPRTKGLPPKEKSTSHRVPPCNGHRNTLAHEHATSARRRQLDLLYRHIAHFPLSHGTTTRALSPERGINTKARGRNLASHSRPPTKPQDAKAQAPPPAFAPAPLPSAWALCSAISLGILHFSLGTGKSCRVRRTAYAGEVPRRFRALALGRGKKESHRVGLARWDALRLRLA